MSHSNGRATTVGKREQPSKLSKHLDYIPGEQSTYMHINGKLLSAKSPGPRATGWTTTIPSNGKIQPGLYKGGQNQTGHKKKKSFKCRQQCIHSRRCGSDVTWPEPFNDVVLLSRVVHDKRVQPLSVRRSTSLPVHSFSNSSRCFLKASV